MKKELKSIESEYNQFSKIGVIALKLSSKSLLSQTDVNSLEVSIPLQLRELLFQENNRRYERSVCTFLLFKSLPFRESGIIHDKTQTLQSISKSFNISVNTLNRHIRDLIELGVMTKIGRHQLRLASYDRLLTALNGQEQVWKQRKQTYKLSTFAENPIKALQNIFLHELDKQQQYAIRHKIQDILSESGTKRKVRTVYKAKFGVSMIDHCLEYISNPTLCQKSLLAFVPKATLIKIKKQVDDKTCLSCISMAKSFNRKAASTGSKHLRRATISRQRRNILFRQEQTDLKGLIEIREQNPRGYFSLYMGRVFQSIPSAYTINIDVKYCRADSGQLGVKTNSTAIKKCKTKAKAFA